MPKKVWVEHGVKRRLGDLKPHPNNSRTHSEEQIAQIVASMGEWDWTVPILIDDKGTILAGHGRQVAGIAKYGEDFEVPVSIARGWNDAKKRAYVIADNRLTELGGWDNAMLRAELVALDTAGFSLDLTGFDLSDFPDPDAGKVDPDEVPPPPDVQTSKLGDVWVLGDHRIICGDSTDAETVARVLAGAKPHLMVTDPPYGVEYDPTWRDDAGGVFGNGKTKMRGKVENDGKADWREAWALFPGDVVYAWSAPGGLQITAFMSLEESGFDVRYQIIWRKSHFVLSRGDYHWQHEPCWYAVRRGKKSHWQGDRTQASVWDIAGMNPAGMNRGEGNAKSAHGTQKPVECMQRPIENNSKRGDAVYEPFSGSGTTIIAAEITGRRCYAIELSPPYVDIAVKRWEAYTGRSATDEAGTAFAEIASQRAAVPA